VNALETIVVEPVGAHRKTVIWLHGIGQDASIFEPVIERFGLPERGIRSVLAQAPKRHVQMDGQEMTVWFDQTVWGLEEADPETLDLAIGLVNDTIDREIRTIGAEQVVLAGFSQGAALALLIGMRRPERIGGLALFAPYVVRQGNLRATRSTQSAGTPIWIGHATEDRVVPLRFSEWIYELLKVGRYPVEFRRYPGDHEAFFGVEYEDLKSVM
jgi:phospholipase/carboxylesterase